MSRACIIVAGVFVVIGWGVLRDPANSAEPALPEVVQFNRDIRPILSNNCFSCHGPDEKQRKADLRLDTTAGAFADLGGYKALVPGDIAKSTLFERITSPHRSKLMPPSKSGKSLKPGEVALIKKWIEQGAKYQGHWAFLPPKKPALPTLDAAGQAWQRNPIDAFVHARLRKEGLKPAEEADRRALLRRVTLDLTGLPPTPEELKAFLADKSNDAYEKLVDRLLASQAFGEHMARYWLDAVRYGDTHGLHLDNYREMYPYRDWVISAFNDNKPFDKFVVEQLAGDLLPEPTVDQLVASGYNRAHVTTSEGGSIREEVYVRNVIDRVETLGTVFFGLTIGCARCHDHKFDPVSQKEFYQLFAFFNSLDGNPLDGNKKDPAPVVRVRTPEQKAEVASIEKRLGELRQQLAERAKNASPDFDKWLAQASSSAQKTRDVTAGLVARFPLDELKGDAVPNAIDGKPAGRVNGDPLWTTGKFGQAFECNGSRFIDLAGNGDFERTQPFSYGAWINWSGANGGMAPFSRMNDGNGHRGYDFYISNGQVAAHIIHAWPGNALKITTTSKLKPKNWQHVFVTYDGSSKAAGFKIYFDGKLQPVTVNNNNLSDTIRTKVAMRLGKRTPGSGYRGLVDEVRVYERALTPAEAATLAGADPIGPLLALPAEKRTKEQNAALRRHYLENQDELYRRLNAELPKLQAGIKSIEAKMPTTLIMKETAKPRDAFILIRGEYDKKGDKVGRDTPSFLPPLPKDAPRNRLGFARWLVAREHPLMARAAVNRFWQQAFGTGIVKTSEDFGSQGEWPSHPELLDWLATQFQDEGWDVKKFMRRLVTSATYRQSARLTPELKKRDPANRLLARGPRFRLDAELLRDQALALSGLLVRKIGGPGVKPYQPSGIWSAVGYSGSNTVRYTQDKGEALYRRSLYLFWKRTAPPPTMVCFDAPSREACCVRRERTNTPLQALVLMNDPQFVEAARHLATLILTEGGKTDEARLRYAFERVTARPIAPVEFDALKGLLAEQRREFEGDPKAAQGLINVGDSKPDAKFAPGELAAWTMVANLLLNLDEVINK